MWLTLSREGSRLAYLDKFIRGRAGALVVDGKTIVGKGDVNTSVEGDLNRSVGGVIFSQDGKRLAYSLGHRFEDGSRRVQKVCDGEAGPLYRRVQVFTFSPDGKRFAYAACDLNAEGKENWFVVCDGKELTRYKGMRGIFHVTFSPDGKRLAYVVSKRRNSFVVCDGIEFPAYDQAAFLHFSSDSRHLVYRAQRGMKSFIVRDGKAEPAHVGYDLALSSDGEHLAYAVWKAGKAFVVLDGRKLREHEADGIMPPIFSPDGKRLAYAVRKDKWLVVCDGREGAPRYESPHGGFRLRFSTDGKHLVHVAVREGKQFLVGDGVGGPPHERIWIGSDFSVPPGKLRYAVADDGEVWRVEVDWPKDLDWTHGLKSVERVE